MIDNKLTGDFIYLGGAEEAFRKENFLLLYVGGPIESKILTDATNRPKVGKPQSYSLKDGEQESKIATSSITVKRYRRWKK